MKLCRGSKEADTKTPMADDEISLLVKISPYFLPMILRTVNGGQPLGRRVL